MLIDINTIARTIGASLEMKITVRPEEIALSDQEYEFAEPVEFEGTVKNLGDGILVLQGVAGTKWKSQCARCLKEVSSELEAKVDATFKSLYHRDQETEDVADPEEEYTYSGFSIQIDRPLRDSLILALPSKVICSEDCKGICGWCGQNLNEKECGCKALHDKETSLFGELSKLL